MCRVLLESYDEGWERLFLDGQLVYQNHSISDETWLNVLKKLGVTAENRLFDPGEDVDCPDDGNPNPEQPYATLRNF